MFIKKQTAAAALAAKRVPAPVNVRSMLAFQPHFAAALTDAFEQRVTSGWQPPKMKEKGEYQPLHALWVSQEYADRVGAKFISPEEETAGSVALPLPEHFTCNAELMKDMEPRVLFNASSFDAPDKLVKEQRPAPRCGLTGNFFRREELVDNLLFAATMLDLKSPFWIKPDHPGLTSGYLTLSPGQDPITVCLTASVFRLGVDIPTTLPAAIAAYLHPTLKTSTTSAAGVNAITGKESANPWLKETAPNGWISLDQLINMWPISPSTTHATKKGGSTTAPQDVATVQSYLADATKAYSGGCSVKGTVIEVNQWDLYNAAALSQPGRLAYNQEAAQSVGANGGEGEALFPPPTV